jgi:membrane protein DedA with SNARE-associated domain
VDQAVASLIEHGYALLFAWVLVEQLALPIPSEPVLLAGGALAGTGQLRLALTVGVAVLGCLLADAFWYSVGRIRGRQVMRFLCRIALEPDSCVRDSQDLFLRYGSRGLLVAKFVPGLNTVAQPLAGILGMRPGRFVAFDALGAAAWTGTYVGLGYVFSDRLAEAGRAAQRLGWWLAVLLAGAAALFLALKWVRRRRFLRQLHVDRITPDELKRRLDQGEDVAIVDMRQPVDFDAAPFVIPGARHLLPVQVTDPATDWRSDREIVLYCT